MVNRIFPSRPGLPRATPAADETASTSAAGQPTAPAPADARPVKSRVLARLGFLPLTKRSETNPARFAYSPASLMPSRIVQNPVDGSPQEPMDVDSSDAGKLLEDSIRATLPALPAAEASRYRRLLDNTLRAANPARQSALLKMLEANVRTAVAHQDAALSQATGWQSFVKTSVNVHFQGSVASMAKAKEEQLLSLQMDILKLPTDLATGYQTLLRAILATKGAAKRDALLTRMAKQVAARADPESEA